MDAIQSCKAPVREGNFLDKLMQRCCHTGSDQVREVEFWTDAKCTGTGREKQTEWRH